MFLDTLLDYEREVNLRRGLTDTRHILFRNPRVLT